MARKRQLEEDGDSDNEDATAKTGKPKTEGEVDAEILPVYVEARKLFNSHEVLPESEIELKWKDCQPEQLKAFLVDEMGFNPDRVQSSIEKLQKAHKTSKKPQMRMDSFFKVKPNPEADAKRAAKRKAEKEAAKKQAAAKKKKGKGGFHKKK